MFNKHKDFIEKIFIIFIFLIFFLIFFNNFDNLKNILLSFKNILKPFFIAMFIAYLFNPLIKILQKRIKNRGICIALVYLSFLGALLSLFLFALPTTIKHITQIINEIASSQYQLNDELYNIFGIYEDQVRGGIANLYSKIPLILNYLFNNLVNILRNFADVSITTFLAIVLSIYMEIDKNNLIKLSKEIVKMFLDEQKSNEFFKFMKEVNKIFSKFLTGLVIEALIMGCLALIGFSLINIKYKFLLASIVCMTNVIPYIGPFIGAIPAVIVTLINTPQKTLWVAIYILIIQQLDGNFIGPKIMGNFIGLSPIWIILAISIGGTFFSLPGIILSVPIAAIIKIIFIRIKNSKLLT